MGTHALRDALSRTNEPRWLVIRDRYSRVLEWWPLKPNADLRAILSTERDWRLGMGWSAGHITRNRAFFFCDRDDERLCIAVERFEPRLRRPVRRGAPPRCIASGPAGL